MLAERIIRHRSEDLPTLPLPIVTTRRAPPMIAPRLLAKAKIVIELPIADLDERELRQAVEWLHGRDAVIVIEMSFAAHVRAWFAALFKRPFGRRALRSPARS